MPIQPEEFRQEEPYELAAVHTDDEFVESLRTSDPEQNLFTGRIDAEHDRLRSMLSVWSAELRLRPLPEQMPLDEATALVAKSAARRRSMRAMFLVASSIVALLLGSAVIGSRSATPGDALWPVTRVMWADRAHSVTAGLDVRNAIDQARTALGEGHPMQALDAFSRANAGLSGVNLQDVRQSLSADLDQLRSELGTASLGTPSMNPVGTVVVTVTSEDPSIVPVAPITSSSSTSAPIQGPTDPQSTVRPPYSGSTSVVETRPSSPGSTSGGRTTVSTTAATSSNPVTSTKPTGTGTSTPTSTSAPSTSKTTKPTDPTQTTPKPTSTPPTSTRPPSTDPGTPTSPPSTSTSPATDSTSAESTAPSSTEVLSTSEPDGARGTTSAG